MYIYDELLIFDDKIPIYPTDKLTLNIEKWNFDRLKLYACNKEQIRLNDYSIDLLKLSKFQYDELEGRVIYNKSNDICLQITKFRNPLNTYGNQIKIRNYDLQGCYSCWSFFIEKEKLPILQYVDFYVKTGGKPQRITISGIILLSQTKKIKTI